MDLADFTIRGGSIVGRDHTRLGKNSQDGYAQRAVQIRSKKYLVGVVSDGCTAGAHNEVVALLLPPYIVVEIERLLVIGAPIKKIASNLYRSILVFLTNIRKQFMFREKNDVASFVQNYLLATVVGFILTEDEGLAFHAGDGLIRINDEIFEIDHQNQSPYIGYDLLEKGVFKNPLTTRSHTLTTISLNTRNLKNLAVATDGFNKNMLARMEREAKDVPLGIQLWMNFVNGPRNPNPENGLFYDDAAIVSVEKKRGGKGDEGISQEPKA